jgi:hypothetical protein
LNIFRNGHVAPTANAATIDPKQASFAKCILYCQKIVTGLPEAADLCAMMATKAGKAGRPK